MEKYPLGDADAMLVPQPAMDPTPALPLLLKQAGKELQSSETQWPEHSQSLTAWIQPRRQRSPHTTALVAERGGPLVSKNGRGIKSQRQMTGPSSLRGP
ncbi:unnamed protein product [Gadus morhua 'NCC']